MSTTEDPVQDLTKTVAKLDQLKGEFDSEMEGLHSSFTRELNKLKKEMSQLKSTHEQNIKDAPSSNE